MHRQTGQHLQQPGGHVRDWRAAKPHMRSVASQPSTPSRTRPCDVDGRQAAPSFGTGSRDGLRALMPLRRRWLDGFGDVFLFDHWGGWVLMQRGPAVMPVRPGAGRCDAQEVATSGSDDVGCKVGTGCWSQP